MTTFAELTDVLSGARRRDARQADEFADLLESGRTRAGNGTAPLAPLVGLARALAPAEHRPEPTFRAALRAQLVAEAAARVPALPAQRTPKPARPAAPRWRHAVAAVAVVSAVTGVGAAAASSQALPGDTLYGLKLRVEAIQLSLADSDLERGRELLEQAEARLGEAESFAAANGTSSMSASTRDELARTLAAMDAATTAGAAALVESYKETGDPESMLLLARFIDRQQTRLEALSAALVPGLRASAQRALDSLARVENTTRAVLPPTAREADEVAGLPGLARADDSALRRGALPPGAATGSGSVGGETSTNGMGGIGDTDAAPSGSDAPADATGATAGAAGAGSSIPLVASTPAVTATATATPVTDPTVPVPSVAAPPAPSVTSPVPDPTTPLLPSATAPAPTVPCVAVPPLTTC